jgi:hypothetical protein
LDLRQPMYPYPMLMEARPPQGVYVPAEPSRQ